MKKNCKNCNKEFESARKTKQHCCKECFSEYRKKPDVIKKTLEKRIKTNIEKYGTDNPSKSDKIKEKTKQTCLKKYGSVSPTLNKSVRKKQQETLFRNFGTKNPQQNKIIQKKQQETLFKNFGVNVPLKSDKIKDKLKETCLEKYGEINPSKNEKIKEKIRNTCFKNFGKFYPSEIDNIKEKMLKNRLKSHYKKTLLSHDRYKSIKPLFLEDEYIGNISWKKKYKFQCCKCNSIFEDTLLSGHVPRCTVCYPIKDNNLESEVYTYIKSLLPNDEVERNVRGIIGSLELDIYIPTKKLAIEFNGLYWHSDISGKKYKKYHLNKSKKCEEKNIKLIHIFEDEWLEKRDIVENRLKHILKLNNKKIHARNCILKIVENKDCSDFLDKHHLQGKDKSSIKIGAYYKNELVSVMTFGKLRTALGNKKSNKEEYEMYRFCSGKNVIVGIGNKLLKYFINNHNPQKIISYADKRWSNIESVYQKMGFKMVSETSPNYWYVDSLYKHRYYRFNFRKDVLHKKLDKFDKNLTEWQNMVNNGWDRIWDCGHLKYEWKYNKKC